MTSSAYNNDFDDKDPMAAVMKILNQNMIDISRISADLQEMKVTKETNEDKHRSVMQKYLEHFQKTQQSPSLSFFHRNQALSMLTIKELENLGTWKKQSIPSLNSNGGCVGAAKECLSFLTDAHQLMNAVVIKDAIMIRDDRQPTPFHDGSVIEGCQRGKIQEGMNYYCWDKSTIWKRVKVPVSNDVGKMGQLHTVVMAQTANDEIVVVDWSDGQFQEKDLQNVRLYSVCF